MSELQGTAAGRSTACPVRCLLVLVALAWCCSGPVDAAYKAIDGLVRVDTELVD